MNDFTSFANDTFNHFQIAKKQDGALEDMSPEALRLQLAALKSA